MPLTWSHVTNWKIFIPAFTRHMTTELDKVMASGNSFSTETLKASPTSCCFLYSLFSSRRRFWMACQRFLGNFHHLWPRKHVTKIGFFLKETMKKIDSKNLFLMLLFETCVAYDLPCTLEKILMAEVSAY